MCCLNATLPVELGFPVKQDAHAFYVIDFLESDSFWNMAPSYETN